MSTPHVDPVTASLARRFIERYDDVLGQPWVAPFYEGSGFFNTGYRDQPGGSQQQACLRLVAELARRVDPAALRVLDAGCGLGASTRALAAHFPKARVTGINVSSRQLDTARRGAPDGLGFAVMDAARLAFAERAFDAVVSVEAAFSFPTRRAFFEEAARVLRAGGRLALSDILYRDLSAIGGWLVPVDNRITRLDAYAAQLAGAGFEDVDVLDVTPQCWQGFCTGLRSFFRARPGDGESQMRFEALVERLEGAVAHYVIASATRARS